MLLYKSLCKIRIFVIGLAILIFKVWFIPRNVLSVVLWFTYNDVFYRTESVRESRSKSPHRGAAKPWTHFAEQGLQSPRELRRGTSPSPPPPLPPRSTPTTAPGQWVCFDEVPERRRTPKRITTLPPQPVYSYVNPDECSCECHEAQVRLNGAQCSDSGAQSRASDNTAQSRGSGAQCSDSGTHCKYKDQYRT